MKFRRHHFLIHLHKLGLGNHFGAVPETLTLYQIYRIYIEPKSLRELRYKHYRSNHGRH